ncbi:MAG: hypothetical protein R3C11_10240 [Planctomycetaceae bacterium]
MLTATRSFWTELLTEALAAFVSGEVELAKVLLRDYINATVGFESVGKAVNKDPKSVMRMLSSQGNPNINNLSNITRFLQTKAGLQFKVVPSKLKKTKKREHASSASMMLCRFRQVA